jgi:hypothetical protein
MTKSSGPVKLNEEEDKLASEVRADLERILGRVRSSNRWVGDEIDEMGDKAHRLHMALKKRGIDVRHHKYMVENRSIGTDHPKFYRHVHPVEDLLKFLDDTSANDDPEDQTIGHKFTIDVHSRRWGHKDRYDVTRTESGWIFSHFNEIPTDTDGRVEGREGSGFFDILDHDSINYPEELPGYLDWLWRQAEEQGLTHEQVQEALTQLADWINVVEIESPGGVFSGYK